jgi:hypothetical protein
MLLWRQVLFLKIIAAKPTLDVIGGFYRHPLDYERCLAVGQDGRLAQERVGPAVEALISAFGEVFCTECFL